MGFGSFFRFIEEAVKYRNPDQHAVDSLGESGELHRASYRRIVLISAGFGLAGVLFGVGVWIHAMFFAAPVANRSSDQKVLLFAPVLAAVWGLLLGAAIGCATAPTEFLKGPMGQKWMSLVGTKSVPAARVVCWIVAAVAGGFPIFLGVLALNRQ